MNGQVKMQEPSGCVQSVKVPIGIRSERRCSRCREIKPISEFSPNYSACRICIRKYVTERRTANIESERERERRWRQNNPEACERKRAKQRRIYAMNREKAIEKTKKWQHENKIRNAKTKR